MLTGCLLFPQSSPRPYRTMLEVAVSALQQGASATPKQLSSEALSLRGTSALPANSFLGEPASDEISDSSPKSRRDPGIRESTSPIAGADSFRRGVAECASRDGKPITSNLGSKNALGDI